MFATFTSRARVRRRRLQEVQDDSVTAVKPSVSVNTNTGGLGEYTLPPAGIVSFHYGPAELHCTSPPPPSSQRAPAPTPPASQSHSSAH